MTPFTQNNEAMREAEAGEFRQRACVLSEPADAMTIAISALAS